MFLILHAKFQEHVFVFNICLHASFPQEVGLCALVTVSLLLLTFALKETQLDAPSERRPISQLILETPDLIRFCCFFSV